MGDGGEIERQHSASVEDSGSSLYIFRKVLDRDRIVYSWIV